MSGATLRFRIDLGEGHARAPRQTKTGGGEPLKDAASGSAPTRVERKARSSATRRADVQRAARQQALADEVERLIEAGELADYADAARRLGVTRARMSQVMALLSLAPAIQEALLLSTRRIAERSLREAGRAVDWTQQQLLLDQGGRP
jgi:hypothetical protein